MIRFMKKLNKRYGVFVQGYSGVQSKNNEYRKVDEVQNFIIDTQILLTLLTLGYALFLLCTPVLGPFDVHTKRIKMPKGKDPFIFSLLQSYLHSTKCIQLQLCVSQSGIFEYFFTFKISAKFSKNRCIVHRTNI